MTHLTDLDIQGIMRLRKQGIPNKEIAERYEVSSQQAIANAVKRAQDPNSGYHKKKLIRDGKPSVPDPPKPKIQRPKAEYSNFQREEYIDKLLKS